MRDSSSLRSCLLLLLVANAALVHASENDDLVFDQDGKQSFGEAPLIESRQQDSLFHRIKRGLWDIFSPSDTTTTTTEAPESEDDNADNELNNAPPVQSDEDKEPESSNLERITRDSAEEYDEADENNEVGNAAESRREPANFGNTDDEDLAGSGEVEGSAIEFDTKINYGSRRERRFYRITLTVGEPYRREYADRSSREYKELSGNLTQPLEELLNRDIPNENHHVNVVKISPTSDSFTSQVTLDIGSTLADETEMQYIIEKQLQIHSLGNVQVRPDGFTFRIFQVGFEEPECDQSAELTCRDGTCVPLERRCDGIADCKDSSDEEGCSETTTQPSIRDFARTDHNEIVGVIPKGDDEDINRVDSIPSKCRADDTIRCRDGSRSICSVQQCDGVKDCDDGDDEDGCPHPGCSPGEFACDVSRCILDSQRCNFAQDCDDGSDEHDCNYPACTASQFKCGNGQCIDSGDRCNNVEDCLDRSDELNCPCGENKFECTPGYCVDKSKLCDGYQDCGNGRDEENCQHITRCRSDEFECLDGSCVSQTSRCDGRSDCRDRSDEINCTVTTCSGDQFRCLDGTCISIDKRCNQNIDCRNGEDESQCGCGEAQFRCTDGRCIGYELQCNGVEECSDGSDERDCDLAPCPSMDFTCNDGSCISKSAVCDGFDNCPRAEDELHCERECTPTQFKCVTGNKCIEGVYRCDGHPDCPDQSDEDCANETITHATPPISHAWPGETTERPRECDPSKEMRCKDGQCILLRRKCDNIFDCLDGSDEHDCGVCTPAEWKCASGECIAEIERCDNVTHCADGSDEIGCECPNGERPCDNGVCINKNFFCDNNIDCHDGSDERDCDNVVTPPAECRADEFTCRDGTCIPQSAVCDRRPDCPHEDDEANCHQGRTTLVGLTHVNQASKDYNPDYQAPANLSTPRSCAPDDFVCADGTCIPETHHCDHFYDCRDFTDEQYCFGCGRDQFQCANGDCIRADQQCNNFIDCDDGSDENCDHNVPPVSGSCPHGYIACTRDKDCVPQSSLCNGVPECRDRSDEENCYGESRRLNLKTYPSEQLIKENPPKQGREVVFQCRDEGLLRARVRWLRGNNLPLPPGSRDVNGRLEIPNIQLEHSGVYICEAVGYPSSTPGQQVSVYLTVEKFEPPPTNKPHACQYDEATCSNGECIPKSYVCNGRLDCTDGSDEMRCSPHGCEPNQFRCNNTECVSKVWRCDGDKDCADGSDEEDCAPNAPGTPCRYTEFACGSHDQCIPKSYHCDLERDCIDGSDEVGCSPVYIVKPPPPMIIVSQGTTLMITCTAIGVPTPEISWRLNWGHVPPKCYMTSINGTGTLSCPDMQPEDQGAYSCEALNSAGFVIAIPDAIVMVNKTGPEICPKGTFNSEARTPDECISCFCFGVATQCHSANLFTYHIPPPFDRHSIVSVKTQPDLQILNDITRQVQAVRGIGRDGVQLYDANQLTLDSREDQEVAYFVMPENYHGNQLKSYGGYLKYRVTYNGTGIPNNAPSVILTGNNYRLLHKGKQIITGYDNEETVRFFDGEWYKQQGWAEVPATREDIMMTLENVDNILIKVQYDDSPYLDVRLTNIVMDTADVRNTGLGSASYVEECECPIGYSGLSCEQCAPGYERRESGPWLGQCYLAAPPGCPLGYYGDPARNIPCQMCPCPLTNPSNQFARTCHLGSDGQPTCDCPAGYIGRRCEQCNVGYRGNPLIPGDMCVPESSCDPDGSLSTIADPNTGRCRCKQYVTGLTCNQCKANTFNLASKNQFGCISCFCMGITDKCVSSNWYRNDIRVSFTNSVRDFSLIESRTPDSLPITDGIRLDTVSREIIYNEFPNRGNNDVYYWQLPSIFLGDQITSYGGNLKYTVRYVPSPGGQSSKNNAADVELISANDINLLYFSKESPEPNTPQTFVVPLLEQYWQRNDGTQADREHLLMALADIRAIRIKATYTTHTDEAALSLVSLDTAEKYNTGRTRAVEVEECSCPVGYKGLSCEDCDVGYTRGGEGLYLGTCEPCYCNGHSNQCNPDTGVCENCAHHTTGDLCEFCEPGYTGDATRGTPYDCTGREVNHTDCNEMGSRSSLYIGDRCDCKRNVEGRQCNRCRPSTFGLSAENPDGCSECYCSGLTDQCHESSLYVQQIPMWVYDNQHGFTLTDSTRQEIIDHRDFELNLATNEIGYRYPDSRRRSLLWSLPPIFTGNKVKSYGGSLTLTQHITAIPGAQSYKDQDIILIGNGITLFWTNPIDIQPDVPLTYSVPFRESEWKRLTTEGPRVSSRTDLMTVLSNLEAILVRATHSEGMRATYISDISLDTAVEHPTGNRRAVQVEVCRCPTGYVGTSCESCTTGYYRDTSDRSVSYLGSCILCPCNNNEESCEMTHTGHVKCHCKPGFVGQYCQYSDGLMVSLTPVTSVLKANSWVLFTCSYKSPHPFYIYFSMTPCDGWPLTSSSIPPGPIERATNGSWRSWYVYVQQNPFNVICCIVDDHGTELIKVITTVTPEGTISTTTTSRPPVNPPKIVVYIREPEFQIVEAGGTVRYHCFERTDNGSLHIRWEKEGDELPVGRSIDDKRGLLIIRDLKVSDSGIYICQISDGVHIGYKNVTLTVGAFPQSLLDIPVPPRVIVEPSSLQVMEGEPAEFRCEATGNPPPRVEWIRVYGPMSPGIVVNNGILLLRSASKYDAAEYKCVARNNVGVDERTIILHVEGRSIQPITPPTITPSQWFGQPGETIVITCVTSLITNLTWSRERNPLPHTASQRDGVLTIVNPTPYDSGIYVCTSTSYIGVTNSTINITVTSRTPAPFVKVTPEKQTVPQGSITEIRCLTSREPGEHMTWSKYLQPLSSNVRQVGDTLRIVDIQIADRGIYVCRVTGPSGTHEASAMIEVERREPPLVEIYPKNVPPVTLDGSTDLQCRATGIPMPELHWSHESGRPFPHNIKQLPGGVLRLTNITVSDGGSYVCTAINPAGTNSAMAYIEVQSMPVISISPQSGMLHVRPGDRVRLLCSANGFPEPSVTWSRHPNVVSLTTNELAAPHQAVYEIHSASSSDEGSYICHASSRVGTTEERVYIRVEDINDGNDNAIRTDYLRIPDGGKVEMRCHVQDSDGHRIYLDWRRVDDRPLPAGNSVDNGVLIIPVVDKSAAGEYVCTGRDLTGNVLFRATSVLEVLSPPRIVLIPPRQTVRSGENPSIECRTTGDEPMNIEWDAIGRSLPHSVTHHRGLLQFHGITYSDAGKYVCKATNEAGTAEAVAEVLVNQNPYENTEVRHLERDMVTYVGQPVRLRCMVSDRATIHWSREGLPLPPNARIKDDYLDLPRVRLEDSGRYICQTQTSHGVSSDYVNLNVSLLNLRTDCTRVNPMQCRESSCVCSVQGCFLLDYYCNVNAIFYPDNRHYFNNKRWIPHYLQQLGATTIPAVSVEVSQDPVNIGDNIDIRCACSGTHNPRYYWSRPNHSSLPQNAQVHGNTLRLSNVTVSDSGLYRCTADTPDGTFEQDFNLVVHGGNNDAPAIETKLAPYGSSLEMDCRPSIDPPLTFSWSKLGGILQPDAQVFESKLKLTNVKAEDAGTYICTVNNDHENIEIPTMLVVTGVVPYFSQAPQSFIALPPLADSYLKFNIEISFKPQSYDGIILYNDESNRGNGDFIMLSLVRGYPQFSFDLGSGPTMIRAEKPVTLGEWHTIKLQRHRKEGTMLVDGEGPYKGIADGRKQGLDMKSLLFVGGVPSSTIITKYAEINSGFVGCISRLVIGEKEIDLIGDQTDSFGITNCETCAENPCNNGGVCQEAATKNGYICLCRADYSGKHCDYVGQPCYPGACGEGDCINKETGFECYCPYGTTGARCENTVKVYEPAFHDDKSYIAHDTPKALRRLKVAMNFNPLDNQDGILMYCAQSEEGLGDFVALVVKDERVEFRYDIGSGLAIIRSNHVLQPGVWTHVSINRDFKEGNLTINGEPTIGGKSPGTARTMTLNTLLYIGGVDRRRIIVNRNAGVDRTFRGCISDLGVSSMNVDILKSALDSVNIDDCNILHPNQTKLTTVITTPPSTTTPYDPCASNPCIHGMCQNTDSYDYSCTCEYGYVGRNCENILKQCELLLPCRNGGTCTDLHGSYKCDCRLGYNGQNCEKLAEVTYDVAFRGDGWLELDKSVMTHEEEREVLGFEISTNKTKGLIMWHGQTPNDLNLDHYMALAVVDGYVEYQYNLGTGPVVIRVTAQKVDDGERHRIILKRQGSDGSIELNGEHMESSASYGTQQDLNARGSVYLGGVPDYAMTYGKYQEGFSGCIYTMEVQDSGAIDIGEKSIRGKNVSPCTRARWIPSSLVFTNADTDIFDAFVPPPPVNIIHPKPAANLAAYSIKNYSLLILLQNLLAFTMDIREQSVLFTVLCIDTINAMKCILS
ncbi:basement membrane-specific heparan sulfate proteoglycan core protein-like isoform X3 [Bombus pascuorum]|uniref:basement membrane-specific heparan sulfate proteoglycan core protein-like isoform X3 n=1 Tax=Bombus pascuorum TaxID=65598 RepID=UPI00298DBF49|nr:basement membrane-specific heparan sulfate proteoglycan core protein-like isoform X3 [Bombus pascuorum]